MQKRCFPPVCDDQTRILILGSLPGDASIAVQQYYGHPRNKFWELVGAVIDVDLRALPYDDRLKTLLAHGVGLWDVIAEAERPGSLDAAIRNESHNPLAEFVEGLPNLHAIAFNGSTSARIGRRQLRLNPTQCILIDLPSSSPAHTLALKSKQDAWGVLRNHVLALLPASHNDQ